MAKIIKHDTDGVKALLGKGELGLDDYTAGGDAGRVYVGTGSENRAVGFKDEFTYIVSPTATYDSGTITSSDYATSEVYTGLHTETLWEIATDITFTNIVFTLRSSSALLNYAPITLAPTTQHFVRIRHISGNFASDFSVALEFTSPSEFTIAPTITIEGGLDNVPENPLLTATPYSTVGHSESHLSSDWEIYLGAALIWSSSADTINLTSIRVPKGILLENEVYMFKVRYNSLTISSGYGFEVAQTMITFPYDAYLAAGGNTPTPINLYGQDVDTLDSIISNLNPVPTESIKGVSFSPDGKFLITTSGSAPFMRIYKRDLDAFTQIADPAVMPGAISTTTNIIEWSEDSNYVAIGGLSAAPRVITYIVSGDTFTALPIDIAFPTTTNRITINSTATKLVITGGTSGSVYNLSQSGLVRTGAISGSGGVIRGARFIDNDNIYVYLYYGGGVNFYNINTFVKTIITPQPTVTENFKIIRGGSVFVTYGTASPYIQTFDIDSVNKHVITLNNTYLRTLSTITI